jgi:hypothetical protein
MDVRLHSCGQRRNGLIWAVFTGFATWDAVRALCDPADVQ